jgi:hypothetical protein
MPVADLLKVIPAFALTALLLAIVPGQGVAMDLRQSLVEGKRAALISVLGKRIEVCRRCLPYLREHSNSPHPST